MQRSDFSSQQLCLQLGLSYVPTNKGSQLGIMSFVNYWLLLGSSGFWANWGCEVANMNLSVHHPLSVKLPTGRWTEAAGDSMCTHPRANRGVGLCDDGPVWGIGYVKLGKRGEPYWNKFLSYKNAFEHTGELESFLQTTKWIKHVMKLTEIN